MKSYRLASRLVGVLMVGVVLWLTACPSPATPTPTPAAGTPTPTPSPEAPPVPRATPTPTPVAGPTGELRVALSYIGLEALDPTLGPQSGVKLPATNLYDTLVGVTPDGQLSPEVGIAQKWESSADKKTWTFTLRKGIKFHNGDELTSEDAKFSIERFIGPKSLSTNSTALRKLVDSMDASDPYKLVIRTKEPYGFMDLLLSNVLGAEGMVMPKKYIQEKGEEYFNRNPIGSGVYKFKEQVIGSYMLFEAQDSHWSGLVPKFRKLMFFLVPEETTRIAMLKVGQADIIEVSREKMKELSQFTIVQKEEVNSVVVWMDRQWDQATFLSDKRVREALNLAVNRQEILDFLFMGQGTLLYGEGFYTPAAVGYQAMAPYPFDPDKAKKLLAEAYPGGVSLDIYSYNRPGASELTRMNEAIAGYLNKVGVKTKIIPTEYATYRALKTKGPANTIAGQASEARPFLGPIWRTLWHSTGLLTMAKDPTMDKMLDELDAALDPKGVGEGHLKMAKYLRDNHMALSVLITGSPYAVDAKKVKGWDLGKIAYDLNIPRGVK